MFHYSLFETDIGTCAIAWSENGVAGIQLPERDADETVARLEKHLGAPIVKKAPPAVIKKVIADLQGHLEGNLSDLQHIVVDYTRVPEFHRKVYEAAREIPPGVTLSYAEVAKAAGSPAAARAVGQAMARNPFPLVVPCHRVTGSNGKMVGFSAFGGCTTKERLLSIERYVAQYDFDSAHAIEYLTTKDKRMAKLIAAVGPFRLRLNEMATPFEALAESIVYQQLTGKAAATIWNRVKGIYKSDRLPHPKKIVQTPDHVLRGAGLSSAKTAALKDLAQKQMDGVIPDLERMKRMDDEEIIERLVSVRGVGRWTVEMLLIFRLGRPDVLPINDYGVRKGFAKVYGSREELPTPKELANFGEKWKPYRSVASWYLWRSLEL